MLKPDEKAALLKAWPRARPMRRNPRADIVLESCWPYESDTTITDNNTGLVSHMRVRREPPPDSPHDSWNVNILRDGFTGRIVGYVKA